MEHKTVGFAVCGSFCTHEKVLAELEQVAKLHLALVYRGTTDGARQFIEAQDALIQESYAEPEEDPIEEGEAADPTAEMPESEVTG